MKAIKIIVLLLFLFIGIMIASKILGYNNELLFSYKGRYLNNNSLTNQILLNNNNNKESYNAELEIPILSLKGKLYNKNHALNNVNKNITLIYPNNFENIEHHTIIIAAHSGNSKVSYFHDLDKLNINAIFYITTKEKRYTYKVISKYETDKNGRLDYIEDTRSLAYLTTCSEKNKDKQLIVIGIQE